MTGEALAVRNVVSGYGDLTVLRDVSFELRDGEVAALLGRNGVGKSTLISTVAGLIRQRSGAVALGGVDVTSAAAHVRAARGLGVVQQNKRIFRRRTVFENLRLGAHILPRKSRAAGYERVLDYFPALKPRLAVRAGALSGGQQQMLAIAQALLPDPRVLLLDEPSAGLAPVVVTEMLHVLRRLRDEGLSVLLVEQMLQHAKSVSDRILVLDQGRIVLTAASDALSIDRLKDLYFSTEPDAP